MEKSKTNSDALILSAAEGRKYNCGTMTAVFKADESETNKKYSISEWWLVSNSDGPRAHKLYTTLQTGQTRRRVCLIFLSQADLKGICPQ